MRPACLYGITKATGMMLADYYRGNHGMHVACGILFNHESLLRGRQFLSQRVVEGLAAVKARRIKSLQIGSLEARVDWGYAPDYTRAMQLILEVAPAEDFIIATGETHSVREMVEIAADLIGLDWKKVVVENAHILQRNPMHLCGDPSRLFQVTGWRPSIGFRDMIRMMAEAALSRTKMEPGSIKRDL